MAEPYSLDPVMKSKLDLLPSEVFNLYGCTHCEWRGCVMCPEYVPPTESSDGVYISQMNENGICDMRIHWLLTLVPNYKSQPSLPRFQMDFAKSLGMVRMRKEFNRLELLEAKMASLEGTEEHRELYSRARDYRNEWFKLFRTLCSFEDSQLTRDTPKNINVNSTTLKPSDVFVLIQNAQKQIDLKQDD